MIEPVYPKEDPEYRKRVLQNFYNKVKNTDWGKDEIKTSAPRGRKPAPPPKPMVDMEKQRNKNMAQKYDWFDKWTKK
jgi:hypothetical protein